MSLQTRPSNGMRTPQSDHVTSPVVPSSTNQRLANYPSRQQQQPRMCLELNGIELCICYR